MGLVILVLVVIGALLAIASGVWVAVALVGAISVNRAVPEARCQTDEASND